MTRDRLEITSEMRNSRPCFFFVDPVKLVFFGVLVCHQGHDKSRAGIKSKLSELTSVSRLSG